jgi:hypothetical protein
MESPSPVVPCVRQSQIRGINSMQLTPSQDCAAVCSCTLYLITYRHVHEMWLFLFKASSWHWHNIFHRVWSVLGWVSIVFWISMSLLTNICYVRTVYIGNETVLSAKTVCNQWIGSPFVVCPMSIFVHMQVAAHFVAVLFEVPLFV